MGASASTAPVAVAICERGSGEVEFLSRPAAASSSEVVVREGAVTVAYLRMDTVEEADIRRQAAALPAAPQRSWPARPLPSATIVICTLGRNRLLVPAVTAALAQDAPDFDVVVVDNAPHTGDTRRLLEGLLDNPRLQLADAPTPGLSNARNAGVAHARGAVVAFTDDDAVTHPGWLRAFLEVFAADPAGLGGLIGAVTGPVFPAELAHEAQIFFEARGGFPKALEPTLWASADINRQLASYGVRGEGGPLFPLTTARVGAGVSMAYPRAVLAEAGSFDTALGAGTASGGGEDLDYFARVLRTGRTIVSTPDAVIHHSHRPTVEGLITQTHGDGTGMAALLTKSILTRPGNLLVLARRVPAVLRRVAPGSERVQGTGPALPPELIRQEIRGFLLGPLLYVKSVWAARRARS